MKLTKTFLVIIVFTLFTSFELVAQVSVSGKTTDAGDGAPLPGVNVVIKGSAVGVTTDFDGNYTIQVPNGDAVLEFSYVGYETQSFVVGGKSSIDVSLQEQLGYLDEVVVVGYGSVKKRDLTGSVVSLSTAEVTLGGAVSSAAQMIQGRAAGVEVSANDGEPGQALNIVIRGNTSISNSNQPLYVVDGFPLDPGVSISPEDIESIDILKDAASAAIYGSRGSSGVVLITTKKGKAGRTDINVDISTGIQSIIGSLEYLDWEDAARITNELYASGPNDGNPWYSDEDLAVSAGNNTNWIDEVTRNATVTNYNIRASGGSENSHFSFSGNYLGQEGIIIGSEFTRASARLNADHKFGNKTKLAVNLYSSRIKANGVIKSPGSRNLSPFYSTIIRAVPGRPAYDPDGSIHEGNIFSRDTQPFLNPIGFFTTRINDREFWRNYGNLTLDHEISDNLMARLNAGYDRNSGQTSQYQPAPYAATGDVPSGSIDAISQTNYLLEGTLMYNKTFGEDHDLNVLAGASTQEFNGFSYGLTGEGFPTDRTSYNNLGSAQNQFINSSQWSSKIISFFSRFNYSYKDKLLLTATIRGDGASQFGENNKWGYFPSVSGAWRLSQESFMENSLFSDLKLRASYGLTGNNNISPYTSLARVGATDAYSFDGSTTSIGLGPDGEFAPNPNLKWEVTGMLNVGLDFGLWDDRLYGSIDVYKSDTDDLIISKPLSAPSTGFQFIIDNVGSMTNKGVEVVLGAKIATGEDFKWDANLNFSTNDNEVTQLDGDNPINIQVARQPYGEVGSDVFRRIIEGGRIGDFYGYKFIGVLQEGETYAPQPNSLNAGTALYEDVNGDGIINGDDRTVIGNANPDFTLGFNNHFEYKGVYLDMFWQGVFGNDLFNFKAIALDRQLGVNAAKRYSDFNTTGTLPGENWFDGEYGSYVNDYFIEDGSYIRLKNMVLGYNISTDKISWIKNVNIYLQGQNLLTITDYTGFDPEVSFNYSGTQSSINRGVDDFGYPNSRIYSLGVKATF
ncbi:SusC/RagA family TonB-linked outer membrane protein [Flagellimonas algicola]|uniref:TonB-dependent receptor n=1 Tax=Flagellimonas algicola TaxID=2583815 RepID=A0ABY2WGN8_9FLAO|nr:TonB-dependent receptor [Allomuricauda algicola]TMU50720.1 TonB-dependent receptor [Allomuricauda algicola]